MEYYNIYNHNYIRVAKRQKKYPRTKIEILDHLEFTLGDISRDVITESDNISYIYNQGVQGRFSFSVLDYNKKYFSTDSGTPLLWFGRKVKIYKGLIDEENGDIYWWSLGVFIITKVTRRHGILSVEGVDKFGLFTADTGFSLLDSNIKAEAGRTVGDIITSLAGRDMGGGRITDPKPPLIDRRVINITNPQNLEFSSGCYTGDALIGIANMCKCRIFYDRNGYLRVTDGSLGYLYSTAAQVWSFDKSTTAEYINSSLSFDFTKVINRITVTVENSISGKVYTSTAINNEPRSPMSVGRIGFKTGKPIENIYGYDQSGVDALADFYLGIKSVLGVRIPLKTVLIPHLCINDVVMLTDNDYNFDDARLLINEIVIKGSDMTVSLVNLDHLPCHVQLI
ncbi:MAG: hypothetical protein FWG70_05870 [Oscillospiraceae bacterium]|nr:hypothetical protein [Oscillospiraceae bacterium]